MTRSMNTLTTAALEVITQVLGRLYDGSQVTFGWYSDAHDELQESAELAESYADDGGYDVPE